MGLRSKATLAKLLAGSVRSTAVGQLHEEHELLRAAASALLSQPLATIRPKLRLQARLNDDVDVDDLPFSAKRVRKRPATAM